MATIPISSPSGGPPPAGSAPSRVCIIYAYPSLSSGHGPRILQTVQKALAESGTPVDLIDLYRENFNPVMGEAEVAQYGKSLPPDAASAQAKLAASEAWVLLYPVWWSTPPAILKGFFDRVLTPGFAFKSESRGIQPMLEGKRALVVRTFASSALQEQRFGMVAQGFMEKAVLGACGVRVVTVDIYSVDSLAESAFAHTLLQISGASRRLLSRPSVVPNYLRSISAPYLPPLEQKPRLPVNTEGEERIELSEEAKSDLEYFKSARRQAREAVHRKADARSGGKPAQKGKNRGFFGQGRGGNERGSFGRGSGERGQFGSGRAGGERGSFGAGRGSNERSSFGGQGRPQGGQSGGQAGGSGFGRRPQGGQNQQGRPNSGGQSGGRPNWSGRHGKRRRH